jgi:AraC-like DNA-binding protein
LARAEGKAAKEPSMVRRFKQLVSQNFAIERSIQAYANRLGVSANHLFNTVKAVTEQTPGQIIRREIALEAKRLLAHSDLSVAEIGYTMAFEDPSYFGRFFRRETGMSPRTFRQHIQEKYQIFPE